VRLFRWLIEPVPSCRAWPYLAIASTVAYTLKVFL
jgi:hypothetical protein